MKKNYIVHNGMKVVVNDNGLEIYDGEEKIAAVWNFVEEKLIQRKGNQVVLKLEERKDFFISRKITHMGLSEEQHEELLKIREEIKLEIESYFNNIENAKLKTVGYSHIVFEKTEEHKELRELNKKYFDKVEEEWIRENKEYFTENKEYEENSMGMYETKVTYTYTKENKEVVKAEIEEYQNTEEYKEKQIEEQEYRKNEIELMKLAEKLSDEDFEDITGKDRNRYL